MNELSKESTPLMLHMILSTQRTLLNLEIEGLRRGQEKGKSMNVPIDQIVDSLKKQFKDFQDAHFKFDSARR